MDIFPGRGREESSKRRESPGLQIFSHAHELDIQSIDSFAFLSPSIIGSRWRSSRNYAWPKQGIDSLFELSKLALTVIGRPSSRIDGDCQPIPAEILAIAASLAVEWRRVAEV
jgi:hypothetical protein